MNAAADGPVSDETLALLKILALGARQVEQSKVKPVADVVKRLRATASSISKSTDPA